MSIDTLRYVKRLEAAGLPRPQAEAHAEGLRDEIVPQLATKSDLDAAVARLETNLGARIEASEAKLGARIDGVDSKLNARIDGVESKLGAMIEAGDSKLGARMDNLESRIEAAMLRHTVAIILGVLAVGSLIARFVR